MLIKQAQRAVVAAWAPGGTQIVGGSAAQQLDASFNTSASLDIFELGLAQPDDNLNPIASIQSANRFHKIVWGNHNKSNDAGIIVGGCDDGILQIYNASKLLESDESALVAKPDKHTGAIRALDFNPFQTNLLATGATQSEIYIWDLNNTGTPMTPGTKSQPAENVQWISWNRQVQHILASAFSSRCVVWDLRKNEPIIKLTDSNGRVSWRVISWHPDVATQLCLASEDDLAPIIQLWDLRFATAPLKVLENHTRGILGIAWCQQDPDLLISCGKDNRILCWNPNSQTPGGEVLLELARTPQWNFEVSWCPKNPALISASSSDGFLSVYSLMGGPSQAQLQNSQQQASQILADSFPGMGDYSNVGIQSPPAVQEPSHSDLAKPPKWLKKPVGAKFAFGGKLVSFSNEKPSQPTGASEKVVFVSQVVTEAKLIDQSNELENAIKSQNFADFCRVKADSTSTQSRRYVWYFLQSFFLPNPRSEMINLLGYKEDEFTKLSQEEKSQQNGINHLSNQMAGLNRGVSSESEEPVLSSDTSADLSPGADSGSAFDTIGTNANHEEIEKPQTPFDINTTTDSDGLITKALLTGNIELAVELCFDNDRAADGLALATVGGSELIALAQKRYLKYATEARLTPIIKALIRGDWNPVIDNCKPSAWKEALVAVLTHTSHHEMPYLVQKLGERLEFKEKNDAILCYICAGNIQNLVNAWWDPTCSNDELQELIEVVIVLQKAIESQGRQIEISGIHAKLLNKYALLLAAEGNLYSALSYIGNTSDDQEINNLRERLYCAIGHKQPYNSVPNQRKPEQRKNTYYEPQPQVQQPKIPSMPMYNTNATSANQTWMQQNQYSSQPSYTPSAANYAPPIASFPPTPANPPTYGLPQVPAYSSTPPPRPPSTPSSQGTTGLPKSKYVLDPSVQSAYGARNSFSNAPISNQPQSNAYQNPMVPTYNQQSYNDPIDPPSLYQNRPMQSMMPPYPSNPVSQSNNPNVMLPPPLPNMPPTMLNPSVSQYNNNMQPALPSNASSIGEVANFSNQQQPFYNLAATTGLPNQQNISAPPLPSMNSAAHILPPQSTPGWNDPPVVNKASKPQLQQQQEAPFVPQNPITHPMFETAPVDHNVVDPMMQGHAPMMPGQAPMMPGQVQNMMNNQPPQNNYNNANVERFPPQGNQYIQPVAQEVVKAPLPAEVAGLKTIFDQLHSTCLTAATTPDLKRKLDDVKRQLESLYDLLRQNKLSGYTVSVLDQMTQCIQSGDYNGASNAQKQLVSGPDFHDQMMSISLFRTGLYTLLQCAKQLQVYLR